jgi:hypothetical protein
MGIKEVETQLAEKVKKHYHFASYSGAYSGRIIDSRNIMFMADMKSLDRYTKAVKHTFQDVLFSVCDDNLIITQVKKGLLGKKLELGWYCKKENIISGKLENGVYEIEAKWLNEEKYTSIHSFELDGETIPVFDKFLGALGLKK